MRLLRQQRFLLLVLPVALVFVGGGAARQLNGPSVPGTAILPFVEFTAPANPGPFGRSVTGDFDGDLRPDLALERGNTLEFVGSPGAYGWWADNYSSIGSVNDLTMIPAVGNNPTDTLVVVGDQGITLCSNFANLDPVTSESDPTTVLLGGSAWEDAVLVEARAIHGESGSRIVGVMQDRRTIRQRRLSGGTYSIDEVITLDVLDALPVGAQVVGLELVNFDGDASDTPEIALATTSGLYMYWLNGDFIAKFEYSALTTTALMRGRDAGTEREWLAWAVRDASDNDWIRIIDITGIGPLIIVPGKPGIVGMTPTFWDDQAMDSRTDMVLSFSNLDEFWVGIHQASGPRFDLTQGSATRHTLSVVDPITPYTGPTNQAHPASADLDGDGDRDLLIPTQISGTLTVALNGDVDQTALQPEMLDGDALLDPVAYSPGCYTEPLTQGNLELITGIGIPPVGDALRVAVWFKSSQAEYTNPVATWMHEFAQGTAPYIDGTIVFDLEDPIQSGASCTTQSETKFSNFYFFELFFVDLDPVTGEATHAYPSLIYGLEAEIDTPPLPGPLSNQDYLDQNYRMAGTQQVVAEWLNPGNDPDTPVGTITQAAALPDTPPRRPIVSW